MSETKVIDLAQRIAKARHAGRWTLIGFEQQEAQELQDEFARLATENTMLREVIAMTDPCIHQAALDAQQAHADGRTITLEQYMADRGLQ